MILQELYSSHLRIGNFLYKNATAVKLCLVHNCEAAYPENYYLWQYLKNPPKTYAEEPKFDELIRPRTWHWTKEEEEYVNSFGERYRNENMAFALNFFFQSAKWWEGYETEVLTALEFKDEVVDRVKNKYEEVFKKPVIHLSLRLGDFLNHGDFFQIPFEFYLLAIQENIPDWKDCNILITSDHIEHARQLFKGENMFFAEPNNTHTHAEKFKYYHGDAHEQLVLGTLPNRAKIIGNSTFSWWQAYLSNKWHGTPIYHSGQVFRGHYANICDTTHYYYPTWVKYHPYNQNGLLKPLNNETKKLLK